ncbi:phage portal protein, partial [Klebsiella pneumoniae]
MELTDKQIKDLVARRHPEYIKKKEHWDFLASTYAGGRAWFDDNIFRYFKEGDQEFKERLERAYRFNHTREVVNLINKYLFKEDIHRNVEEAPEPIQKFWKRATRQNVSIDGFMSALDLQSSIYGRVWVVVDSTMDSDAESVADEKKKDVRAYAYWISPQQMLDMAWDDDGNLIWALIVEVARDDQDPFTSSGQEYQRYRLWTRNEWYLFREEVKKGAGNAGRRTAKVVLEDKGEHKLGVVPVFPVDCIGESESPYFSPS